MKQDFYDCDYFVKRQKGGAEMFPSDAIAVTKRFLKWGVKEFFDMGCGTGILIAEARRQGIDAFGCDFSEYAFENAEPEAKPFMSLIDIILPITKQEHKFDWVILYSVLEHLEDERAVRQAIINAMEMCRPEGKIFCLVCEEFRKAEVSHHFLQPRDWWLRFFSQYKLHDISEQYFEEMGETNIPQVARDELFILERL